MFDPNIDRNTHGVHEEEQLYDEDGNKVDIPQTRNPLSDNELSLLVPSVDPLQQSNSFGADLYLSTLFKVGELLLRQ